MKLPFKDLNPNFCSPPPPPNKNFVFVECLKQNLSSIVPSPLTQSPSLQFLHLATTKLPRLYCTIVITTFLHHQLLHTTTTPFPFPISFALALSPPFSFLSFHYYCLYIYNYFSILENFVNFRFSVQLNFIKLISISKPNNIKAYHSHWKFFLTIFLL